MSVSRVVVTDGMKPDDKDATAFMQGLVDAINETWLRHGAAGGRLVRLLWHDRIATVETIPSDEPLTVDMLRKALKKE